MVCSTGERAFAPSAPMDDLARRARSEPKPRAFVEMLPPIRLVGIVVMGDYYLHTTKTKHKAPSAAEGDQTIGLPRNAIGNSNINGGSPLGNITTITNRVAPAIKLPVPSKRDP